MPVIIAPALPLALRLAANKLLGMIGSRLKDLLTIWTAAITHEAAPAQNAMESFCSEPPLSLCWYRPEGNQFCRFGGSHSYEKVAFGHTNVPAVRIDEPLPPYWRV